MSEPSRGFGPADAVVGDYAWGADVWLPHPVIQVNRASLTLGIHRHRGVWLTTQVVRWEDVRGVIPAEVLHDLDLAGLVRAAAERVRAGFLSDEQREALGDLLLIAAIKTLPTPVTVALHNAIAVLTRPPSSP